MNIHSFVPEVVTEACRLVTSSNLEGCTAIIMLYSTYQKIMLYSRAVAQYRIANAWRILWYADPDIVVFY